MTDLNQAKYVLIMAKNDFCSNQGMVLCVQYKLNASCYVGRCAGVLLLATTLHGVADDQIQVYTVPKEHAAIAVSAAPISWTTPAGWNEKPADGIRLGSFAIQGENGGKAEVAITSFP